MTTPRTDRKLGRKPNAGRPRVRLTTFHLPASYTPPSSVDRYSAVMASTWGMDGNDSVGDCTCADVDHELKSVQVSAGNTETTSTATEVLAAYSAITGYNPADPNTDQGAEMQSVREYWQKTGFTLGGTDHTILLFAEVDISDVTVAQWVLDEFGAVGVGVNLPQSAMDQFDAGQTWDVVANDGGILGGHAIALVGYTPTGPVFLSWARVVHATWAWWHTYVEEAWAAFLRDIVNAKGNSPTGESLCQLGQEFAAQFGKPNPIPTPSPTPVPPSPSPTPAPDAADMALVSIVGPWSRESHFTHKDRVVARAFVTWMTNKNYV